MKVKELFKDVQDVELTAEQEKQIKDYLGIKEPKVWKPDNGEKYFCLLSDGSVESTTYYKGALFCACDLERYTIGNCFKTKEEAEFVAEQIKVYTELKRYAAEHNEGEIDWRNSLRCKYCIIYDHVYKTFIVSPYHTIQNLMQVYFTSSQIARDAIKAVGEDRIKKYLFGVK